MTHKIGDIVTPDPDSGWPRHMLGQRYKITDLPRGARGVNYKAAPCDADGNPIPGQGLRGPARALVNPDVLMASAIEYVPLPRVGTVCSLSEFGEDLPEGFYTIIGHTDATRVRAVKIGDLSGRYYRVSGKVFRELDGDDVYEALSAI